MFQLIKSYSNECICILVSIAWYR